MSDELKQATTQGKIQNFETKSQALMQMGGAKAVQKQQIGRAHV